MDDIVAELTQRCAGQGRTRELMTEAADEIERLRKQIASLQVQKVIWREMCEEAQDKADALLEKLYGMELRCDCS